MSTLEQMLTGLEAASLMLLIRFYALRVSEFLEISMISQRTNSCTSWTRLKMWNAEPWFNILFWL